MALVRLILGVVLLSASTLLAADQARIAAVASLQRQLPQAQISVQDDHVRQINGPSLSTGVSAAASQEAFLNQHAAALGVEKGQLVSDAPVELGGGKFTLFSYRQQLNGIEVYDRWVKLLVRNRPDHPLVLVNSSIEPAQALNDQPGITKAGALASARRVEPQAVNFSMPRLVYHRAGEGDLVLAWQLYGDNGQLAAGFDRWEFFIDANSGDIVELRPGYYHTDIVGTVTGFQSPPPFPDQANNPPANLPVNGARVRVGTGTPTYTDVNGEFVLPHGGTSAVTVSVDLVGRWATITNVGAGGSVTGSVIVTPPGPANVTLNPTPSQLLTSQLNAMTHVTLVHDFVKSLNPAFTGFDISMPTFVNINDSCNAGYSPGNPTLNFFHAAGGCPNTAYAGVVYHEYGHFVVDFSPGGPDTGDYHEGMADVLSTLLADDPCLGHDFFGQNSGCLRNVQTATQTYPCSGGSHTCGQVIGRAFWDMRTNLIATEGASVGLELARDFYIGQIFSGNHAISPSVAIDVLTLDDDDANLQNGTPHYEEICSAFNARNLTCPEIVHVAFDYPDGRPALIPPNSATTLRVDVSPFASSPVPGTGIMKYRTAGTQSFSTQVLVELAPNEYEATLPGLACGQALEYYFSVDAAGIGEVTDPTSAPSLFFQALSASLTEMFVAYDFETAAGWTVDNSPDLTDGAWNRGIPANGNRGDPPADFDGSGQCFLTDNVAGNSDVDGGTTTLTSPVFDLNGLLAPRVRYARWYSNSAGDSPFADIFEVEVSNNGGGIWVDLETVGPTGAEVSGGWFVVDERIGNFVQPTGQFQVRFHASDLGNGSVVEAAIDAFEIYAVQCATCSDGIQNQGEDRIDCGGAFCPACECVDDSDCDDLVFCNGMETCDPQGNCLVGSDPCPDTVCDEIADECHPCADAAECDDGVDCTVNDCQGGFCVYTPDDGLCDNGLFCDGSETCDAQADCQSGTNPCPSQGCNDATDACTIPQVVSCRLVGDLPRPGGQMLVDFFVENVAELQGYDLTVSSTLTFGGGSLSVACPDGIVVDTTRVDHVFQGLTPTIGTSCGDQSFDVELASGGVNVGAVAKHLGRALMEVSPDATIGSSFDIAVSPAPVSLLHDSNGLPIEFVPGTPCTLTVQDCTEYLHGDVDYNTGINLFDLFCILEVFQDNFSLCSFDAADVSPCGGNGTINILDLFVIINAFNDEHPCPNRCIP